MKTGTFKNIVIISFTTSAYCTIIFKTDMRSNNSNIFVKAKTLFLFVYRSNSKPNPAKRAIIVGKVCIRISKITRDYHIAAFGCPIIYRVRISFSVTFKGNVLSNIRSFQLIWYREHGWNCKIEMIFAMNYVYILSSC